MKKLNAAVYLHGKDTQEALLYVTDCGAGVGVRGERPLTLHKAWQREKEGK